MGKRHRRRRARQRQMMLVLVVLVVIMVLVLGILVWSLFRKNEETEPIEPAVVEVVEEPEEVLEPEIQEEVAEEEAPLISTVKVVETETDEQTVGIDVSEFQGNIDWEKVASSGYDFVMVRCGYRTKSTGIIKEDVCARYNLQEAHANGMMLGAYFYSTAVTEEEAREEAWWLMDLLAGYPITYPVVYDCEGFQDPASRQYGMTVEERSHLAEVFLDEIEANGYTGMFYGARNELTEDLLWKTSELEMKYRMWIAQYPEQLLDVPEYDGKYVMWQYTNQGNVSGIKGDVDLNRAWIGYSKTAEPKKEGAAEYVEANMEAGVSFEEVNETVTAKDVTNLRKTMSQGDDSNVVGKLKNGETATRTGKGNNGWSRVEYNGQVLYAVSSYLTTDLSYTAVQPEPDDGFKQTFSKVSDHVTAKDVVNLRTRPSMEESEVFAQLVNGQVIQRTGVSDMGWSRVICDGVTVYCISSYLQVVE